MTRRERKKKEREDAYQAADQAADDLFDAPPREEPPEPEVVCIRGTRMTCPHCLEVAYFGLQASGFDKDRDFTITGATACCGKSVRVRFGHSMSIEKLIP